MLLDKLIKKQNEMNQSDSQFARLLGIHRTTWMHTRNKKIRIGEAIITGTIKAFPELTNDVVIFLNGDDNKLSK